jgi:hypothetical protein
MAKHTFSSIVPACTLSTRHEGKGRIPRSQCHSIPQMTRVFDLE